MNKELSFDYFDLDNFLKTIDVNHLKEIINDLREWEEVYGMHTIPFNHDELVAEIETLFYLEELINSRAAQKLITKEKYNQIPPHPYQISKFNKINKEINK